MLSCAGLLLGGLVDCFHRREGEGGTDGIASGLVAEGVIDHALQDFDATP